MSEMVDRVAKALAEELERQHDAPDQGNEDDHDDILGDVAGIIEIDLSELSFDLPALARVAIAAMRKPTQAMVERGGDNRGRRISDDDPHSAVIWRDMIDEALKPVPYA